MTIGLWLQTLAILVFICHRWWGGAGQYPRFGGHRCPLERTGPVPGKSTILSDIEKTLYASTDNVAKVAEGSESVKHTRWVA